MQHNKEKCLQTKCLSVYFFLQIIYIKEIGQKKWGRDKSCNLQHILFNYIIIVVYPKLFRSCFVPEQSRHGLEINIQKILWEIPD